MSQLKVEKLLRFSQVRIFITLFNLLLSVFTRACISAKSSIINMATMIAKSAKLSSDDFSKNAIEVSNKEPSKKDNAEDFLVTRFGKIIFYKIKRINETPLQLFDSCEKFDHYAFAQVSRSVDFPIFKTKMII